MLSSSSSSSFFFFALTLTCFVGINFNKYHNWSAVHLINQLASFPFYHNLSRFNQLMQPDPLRLCEKTLVSRRAFERPLVSTIESEILVDLLRAQQASFTVGLYQQQLIISLNDKKNYQRFDCTKKGIKLCSLIAMKFQK